MEESGALYELRIIYDVGSGASECHIYPKGQTWHVCLVSMGITNMMKPSSL